MADEASEVLLVEDSELYGRAITRMLRRQALRVRWVRSCAEARALLGEQPQPAIRHALIDDHLPDGWGVDLLSTLAELTARPALALYTAHRTLARTFEALRQGQVLWPKPSSREELVELLSFLERQRRGVPLQVGHEALPRIALTLDPAGLATPHGFIHLPASSLALTEFLCARGEHFTPSQQVARALFARRDHAGPLLVRQYVHRARRALGLYAWLLESHPKKGYRIAPRAVISAVNTTAPSLSRLDFCTRRVRSEGAWPQEYSLYFKVAQRPERARPVRKGGRDGIGSSSVKPRDE